ncbi:hypothetical protein WA026_008105 [Henosepilachna vigintioctopunctata]|uniref:Uncharacterized protein n=1 Tax=Henosepilachna vigintioctopunctata TaxID=420089 RepID=A0AAW1TQ65_9CUCU
MDKGRTVRRKPFPKQNAGFLSLLTFSYLLGFLRNSKRKEIEEHDLFNVMDTFQSKKLGDDLEKQWKLQKAKKDKATIIYALFKCYGLYLLGLLLSQATAKVIFLYSLPYSLSKFISYFNKDQTDVTSEMAICYASIMVGVTFLNGLWEQHFTLWKMELGIKMQAAVSSLLYRKSLSLSISKVKEISTGKIVTSIVKDVVLLNDAILYGIEFVLESFQVILVCFFIYDKVGIGSIGGLSIIFISMIFQVAASRATYLKRDVCNEKTDQRLQQTQEVLSFIRLIKMYRWESFFRDRLQKLRKYELSNLKSVFIWKSIAIIFGVVSGRIAQTSIFVLYMYLGNKLDAGVIYYIQQLFHKIAAAMVFIPLGIQSMADFLIATKRVNFILNSEENNIIFNSTLKIPNPAITMEKVDVKSEGFKILNNINIKLTPGLNILIGPSGCGKSTLLKTILEEYNTTSGKLHVRGKISYASQTPWLFPSSVKQNILFGQSYDKYKYEKVLEICCLTDDINTFVNGDETILTDCGANLSKGQQGRINLARAIYRDSDIYLLDDCFASLDVHIKTRVFENVIKNYLNNKLCVLVTHSTQFVKRADYVVIMENHSIKFAGEPETIPKELYEKMEENQNDDVDESAAEIKRSDDENEINETEESTTLLSTVETARTENIYLERKKTGRVGFQCYKSYFKYGGGLVMFITIFGLHIMCEFTNGLGEKLISKWVNEQKETSAISSINLNATIDASTISIIDDINTTYPSTTMFSSNYSTENLEPTSEPFKIDMFTLYVAAMIISTVFIVIRCFSTYYFTIKVSKNLHNGMVNNILQGCMFFFDTHLIGHILTRFSKDLFIMDELIPFVGLEGLRVFFLLPMCLVLIATVSLKLAGASIVLAIVLFYLSEYILTTTRSTQRLCNSTLSPIIGHANASLEGLIIIRAFGTQHVLKDEFDRNFDMYVSANHLREVASRVLGFYSITAATLFTAIITFVLFFFSSGILAGDVGLVLSQASMMCVLLKFGIVLWMITENSMTSVERVLEYTKLPTENQNGRDVGDWPSQGAIEFKNVNLTYKSNGETVLKNLSFKINPKEKIGIVGRTGAGKSSIIVTLFRMYDFLGDILIDDENIRHMSLECLRTNLSIIPQDPVIFTGTVRENIDPKQTLDDSQVWKILEIVNLKSHFQNLDENLAHTNLSIGQKQLICLARALTRKSKIVILDEATANMDEEMDSLIQTKIRELFQSCTLIIIAHRLHTVINCDKIIVMDNGKIVEFDKPQVLLQNTDGLFYKMLHDKKTN